MKKQKVFFTEAAYLLGTVVLAIGTALMEKADFGMSMVVAPAYLFYLKVSQMLPEFTFGMAEYCFQALLLVVLSVAMRRFKAMYLFSFVTALWYGFVLDLVMALAGLLPALTLPLRLLCFLPGMLACALGVALLFHTYFAPEAYELFVREMSEKYGFSISRTKTCYDCISCAVAVVMSFAFYGFGRFEGVKLGTIVCALCNGWLIGKLSSFLEAQFEFRDCLKLRRFF